MPTWGEMIKELSEESQRSGGKPPFDTVRRRYLDLLSKCTRRNTILYATKWTQPGEGKPHVNEQRLQRDPLGTPSAEGRRMLNAPCSPEPIAR